MILLIKAELRKNWKTKKFLIAICCFLCFMGCAYLLALDRDNKHHQVESYHVGIEFSTTKETFKALESELQFTPTDQEPATLRARYELWKKAFEALDKYLAYRQAPEAFGWDVITREAYYREKTVYAIMNSEYYQGEFDDNARSIKEVKTDMRYYQYLQENGLPMYTSPYEPTLVNFIMQFFQNETMILLIIISAFFIIDQLCHDFDFGTYKNIYQVAYKRSTIMGAKIISCLCMNLVAFLVALVLFCYVPITQHGVGSIIYPYIFHGQMILFIPLFLKTIVLMLLVLLFYMAVCVIGANLFKNTTNTLLFMTGILLVVYMSVHFFGTHIPLLTWLPFYFLYPYEIISGGYDYPFVLCLCLVIGALLASYMLFNKKLANIDLKGSESL